MICSVKSSSASNKYISCCTLKGLNENVPVDVTWRKNGSGSGNENVAGCISESIAVFTLEHGEARGYYVKYDDGKALLHQW